jgi:hypothetical protein
MTTTIKPKISSTWYVALIYALFAGAVFPYFIILIMSKIFYTITYPNHNIVYQILVTIVSVLSTWPCVLIYSRFFIKRYIIKDKNEITSKATLYLTGLAIFGLIYPLFLKYTPPLILILNIIQLGGPIIVFNIASKKYLKNFLVPSQFLGTQ